jgi:pilus assembly protein CpaF
MPQSSSTAPIPLVTRAAASAASASRTAQAAPVQENRRPESYYITKSTVFGALIEAIDLPQLSKMNPESARDEISIIINEIISVY